MSTCADAALRPSPGEALLGRWRVTGQPVSLATGVLIPVRDRIDGREARARVHWPSLVSRATARRLRAVADFLGSDPHPGWLPLLEAGEEPGGTLIHVVAEAPSGSLLDGPLPLPWRRAVEVAAAVGEALGAAHARGAVHRDVSPANILFGTERRIWLGDWDSALVPGAPEHADPGAPSLGTPGFMSPEQEVGDPLDPRADVFAMGMTLRMLLVGQPPIPDGTPVPERYARLTAGDFPSPSTLAPGCPEAVDDLVVRLCAPDLTARPGDGTEAAALARECLR